MSVEIRKREVDVHETGTEGGKRTDVSYELGAEIDGVFVPFATVSENRVADFKGRAELDNERRKKEEPQESSGSSSNAAPADQQGSNPVTAEGSSSSS